MSNAAIYARISEDKAGDAAGVNRQLDEMREMADRRGWRIVGEYVDNDVSAYSGKPRPEYDRLLADVDAGIVQAIVAWQPDRLVRRTLELEHLITLCESRGVTIATMHGEVNLDSPMGRAVAKMLASIAQAEVEQKGLRQKRANRQRAEQGHTGWTRRPYGYDRADDGVVTVPAEADEVRTMANTVLDGGTLHSAVADLNSRGVPTTTGARWTKTAVRRILLNPRYAGIATYQGTPVGPGAWEAIVTADQQETLRAVLSAPSRKTAPADLSVKYLLSGIVRCGRCGERMYASPMVGKGRRWMVYKCRAAHLARRLDLVDGTVQAWAVARLAQPDTADLLAPPSIDAAEAAATVRALTGRMDDLAEMFAEGLLTAQAMRSASATIAGKLAAAQASLATATAASPLARVAADLDGTVERAAQVWTSLDLGTRRAVLRLLTEQIAVLPTTRGARYADDQVQIVPTGSRVAA